MYRTTEIRLSMRRVKHGCLSLINGKSRERHVTAISFVAANAWESLGGELQKIKNFGRELRVRFSDSAILYPAPELRSFLPFVPHRLKGVDPNKVQSREDRHRERQSTSWRWREQKGLPNCRPSNDIDRSPGILIKWNIGLASKKDFVDNYNFVLKTFHL